jgi:hypothetical protein
VSDILSRPLEGDYDVRPSKAAPSVIELDPKQAWKIVDTIFTAVFPHGEEPPAYLVDECRRHDPFFVPLWCWKVYLTPANTKEKVGFYVIARYVPSEQDKNSSKAPVKLTNWPATFPFNPSRIFELLSWTIKWPKGSSGAKLGIPEPAKPFDARLVAYVKAQEDLRRNHSTAEILRMLDTWEENDQKELRALVSEAEYQLKQDWREMKKCVEEGRMLPPVWEPRPFADAPTPPLAGESD